MSDGLNNLKEKLKANINSIYLGQMTRDISHDVANIITIMIGKTRIVKGLMEKDPLDKDKIKKMIGDIENNFQRILNIIFFQRVYYIKDSDAIFTYAKPEELVLDLKNLFEDRLTKKGITLKIENAIGPGEPFILNKFLILRSISYLIQNSIESMTLDSLEVSNAISIYLEKNGDKLLIKVSDNGKKISEDVVKTMFNPFVSTKDDLTSMGLGLSLVVEILQKIGATIKFQQNGETKEFLIEFF